MNFFLVRDILSSNQGHRKIWVCSCKGSLIENKIMNRTNNPGQMARKYWGFSRALSVKTTALQREDTVHQTEGMLNIKYSVKILRGKIILLSRAQVRLSFVCSPTPRCLCLPVRIHEGLGVCGHSHATSSSPCFILTLLTLRLLPAKVKAMCFEGHGNQVYFLCFQSNTVCFSL